MGTTSDVTVNAAYAERTWDIINRVKLLFPFALLPEDEGALAIAAAKSDIRLKDAQRLRAWVFAKFPNLYEQFAGPSQGKLRILLDENMPYQMGPVLHRYGYISSVPLMGWTGKPDRFLYHYARLSGKFDAIITKDRAHKTARVESDLSVVAENEWKRQLAGKPANAKVTAPVLVQIPNNHAYRDGTVDVFEEFYDEIYGLIRDHSHLAISVSPSQVSAKMNRSLGAIWRRANPADPGNEHVSQPRVFSRFFNISTRMSRSVPEVSALMERVRYETALAYREFRLSNGTPTTEEILSLLDKVLESIKPDEEERGLMALEMAVRAVRKIMQEEPPRRAAGLTGNISLLTMPSSDQAP